MSQFSGDKIRQRILLLLSFLIVCAALWAARDAGQQTDLRMRRALVRQTRNVAATISPADVRVLSFTAKDKELPEFKRLGSHLKTYAQTVGLRSLYTMALRDDQILFGPESLSPDDPYASPPGTVYQEPSVKDFEIFKTGKATVQGPRSDEYGDFVSASVPVIDPRTGKVLMVVGLDQEASVWQAEVQKAQWGPFLTGMVPLGILLAGYWVLEIRRRKAHTHYNRLRHTETVTCATLLLLLTLIAARLIHNAEKKSREDTFYALAQIKAGVYIDSFKDLRNSLHMLVRFFEFSDSVSRKEFSSYCKSLIDNYPIQACFWLPEVSAGDAQHFAKKIATEDTPDFSIWQLNDQGEPAPSQEETLYPLLYVEPLSIHKKALGYDLYSEPLRRTAIRKALTSGEATATDPVSLVAPFDKPSAILIVEPVSAKRQKGMAGLAVRPGMLLSSHLHNPSGETLGLSVALFQLHEGEEPGWLASSLNTSNQNCWETMRTGMHTVIPVFAFGKTYGLLITPEPKWLAAHPLYHGRMALGIGLILTVLMTTLVAILANRPALLEKRVQQRTEELAESEERYKSLHNASFGGIAIHDQGQILECNRGLSEITGYSLEELIGMNGLKLIAPDSLDLVMKNIQAGFEKPYEANGVRKNGEVYPLRLEARKIVYKGKQVRSVEFRDITERKQAEAELRRLSTAIEQSPETIVITDSDGIIQYVNPAFETVTGYPRGEALGKTPDLLKSGQQDNAFYSNLWKTITSGNIWEGRFVNKRRDGSLYTENASIAPVRSPEGQITGYVAVKRDITEELAKEEQFRQAQKMESVGQLAGGIAHDFNNILQAILGFSEILLGRLDTNSMEHRNASEIQKAAKRAAELVQHLLAFSRKQPVERKQIDLNADLRDAEVLLQILLGSKVVYNLELTDDLHPIYADHGQVTQIVMNLAVNARDAMPEGGRLTLSTENITFEPQAVKTMPEAEPGSFVCLSITDTGCGMSQEVKDHLFEPFFTTKEVGRGTGLGLAVVYGIVKQNNGWLHVYSEEGLGSTFKIYLPADKNAAPGNPENRAGNSRILLVEDDTDTRNLVIRILKESGYEVIASASSEEALQQFEKESGRFDLLFSDMILPGKPGLDLADELKAKNPALPVLLYSGYHDQRERWANLESKGYGFLQKPFSVTGLLSAVHDALQT